MNVRIESSRRLLLAALGAFLLAAAVARTFGAAVAAHPNVVILLADDQGWGDLGVNGNTNLATPQIDSLARAGATFDRFYVCPVCAPTRAEFLTGRYYSRGGVRGVDFGGERLNPDERTIAEAFKAAGYATGIFGKWHNGGQWPYHPNARGFDEFYGFAAGHWGDYFDAPLQHNGQFVRAQGYLAEDFTTHALAFIERNKERPFLCYLPFNIPHSPFAVPDEDWNRFKDRPLALRGREGGKEEIAVTRCVLAMCENIDRNVGRVLRRLDELGLSENTIVIYFSDNGPNSWRWNGGMKGRKGSVDEGGVRAPFFIRWPGKIKPGTKVSEIAGAIDLYPTLAHLAGLPSLGGKPFDGKDISPLLLGAAQAWPQRMIFSSYKGKFSVRNQRYRLGPAGDLYDLTIDPSQAHDLAAELPVVARNLGAALAAWRADVYGGRTALALPPDDRPFPVGYPEFPLTPLAAGDGVPHGSIKRSSPYPNCSYFTNWKTLEDSVTWDIAIHTPGDYDVAVYYTCAKADAGATVAVEFNGARASGSVSPAWDPPVWDQQIRLPRGESYMKDFHPLKLGVIHLEKGRGLLKLRALAIPGTKVMDAQMVTLTLRG